MKSQEKINSIKNTVLQHLEDIAEVIGRGNDVEIKSHKNGVKILQVSKNRLDSNTEDLDN